MNYSRTARLAQTICNDLKSPLVALCVLKGGYQFFTDLLDSIKNYYATASESRQIEVDFIRLKSYVVSDEHSSLSLGVARLSRMKLRVWGQSRIASVLVAKILHRSHLLGCL
jgi:hypoxanthine-guanine phosphoribosyltransferase